MKTEEVKKLIKEIQSSFGFITNLQMASANEATGRIVAAMVQAKSAEELVNKAKELMDS